MMPTSTAQMPTNQTAYRDCAGSKRRFMSDSKDGFTLLETLLVLAVMSLLTGVAMMNFVGMAGKSSFKNEAAKIVNVLKMAQAASSQNGRRYAVEFDFIEQTYALQEIRSLYEIYDSDMLSPDTLGPRTLDTDMPDPDMRISTTLLSDRCRIEFITFDDGDDTREKGEIDDNIDLKTYFITGKSGWRNGGKIGLTDSSGNEYSIIINRMSKNIILEEGDIDTYFLEPKDNLAF
jgi:prepilin-type N-terminal cleavage/methylation domain-containing protein